MSLKELHLKHGAVLAPDGIPLQYGDLLAEYEAGIEQAILLDRSHEGRVQVFGEDRFELLNRMSTNKMIEMAAGEGRPTLFLNPNARVIDRVIAYNRSDHLLLITEPGRGDAVTQFLQRNIFFNDDARVVNITTQTAQFAVHGKLADEVMASFEPATLLDDLYCLEAEVDGATIFIGKRKAISHSHWVIVVDVSQAEAVYQCLISNNKSLKPAGGLTFNTLRIRAGRLARTELNTDYIPLELGLWDEVNFAKGCYTGQEIIARMESRAKLAKTIVALEMPEFVEAPADVKQDGRSVGTMTSSVQAPTGEIFAIAIIKTQAAISGTELTVGDGNQKAIVQGLIGVQPDTIK